MCLWETKPKLLWKNFEESYQAYRVMVWISLQYWGTARLDFDLLPLKLQECKFSGCSIAISGQQAECQPRNIEEFTEEQICQEILEDVDIDAIFD